MRKAKLNYNDGDGVPITIGGKKWFDDGHSVDPQTGIAVWTHGTVISHGSGLNNVPVTTLQSEIDSQFYVRPDAQIHENKPTNPPGR